MITACIIVIGNEILSGRTQDKNLAWLAKELNECGIRLMHARVIPDDECTIIDTVNSCRREYSYIFTTGGIGPTHDDITSLAIAKAFGLPLERNAQAQAILARHYGAENLNEARLKMADVPAGASLILNPVSAAPGFHIENLFVFAGVPSIMQAMFDAIRSELKGGKKTLSRTLSAYITEGVIARQLSEIQGASPDVEIGSYPFMRQGRLGTSLVARGTDAARLDTVYGAMRQMLLAVTPDVTDEDLAA